MTRTRRVAVPVLSVVALLLALTACGGGGGGGDPTTSPTPSTSGSPTAEASPSGSPSDDPATPVTAPPCTRQSITSEYTATDGTAGHLHGILTVENISMSACSLSGYPSVFFQYPEIAVSMGAVSTNDPQDPGVPFDLAPGATGSANITIVQAGIVDGCDVVETDAFVYSPPGLDFDVEVTAQHVDVGAIDGCNNDDISLITVGGFSAD